MYQTRTTSQLLAIPEGNAGTRATLQLMRSLTQRYKKALPIRLLAMKLVRRNKQKDFLGEARAIHCFVKNRIRYVKDIRGVETIQTPVKTLEFGQGDCDDKSTLVASLLESIGHPTRFMAVGFQPRTFSHVFTEVFIKGRWVAVETTEPWPLGKRPDNVVSRLIVSNT